MTFSKYTNFILSGAQLPQEPLSGVGSLGGVALHARASISKINIRERDIYIRTPHFVINFSKR